MYGEVLGFEDLDIDAQSEVEYESIRSAVVFMRPDVYDSPGAGGSAFDIGDVVIMMANS